MYLTPSYIVQNTINLFFFSFFQTAIAFLGGGGDVGTECGRCQIITLSMLYYYYLTAYFHKSHEKEYDRIHWRWVLVIILFLESKSNSTISMRIFCLHCLKTYLTAVLKSVFKCSININFSLLLKFIMTEVKRDPNGHVICTVPTSNANYQVRSQITSLLFFKPNFIST